MRDNRRNRVTVCTPTYLMTQGHPNVSKFLGWMLFFLCIFALIFLVIGVVVIISRPMLSWLRNCLLAGFLSGSFLVLIGLFLVDTLASIENHLHEIRDNTKNAEEHLYSLLSVVSKREIKAGGDK